jgi:hypothetical protein
MLLKRDSSHRKNKLWLRVKGWEKVFQANGTNKQAGIDIHISDKVDFNLKSIRRDNEGKIHQEEISILNRYAPKYIFKNSNGPKSTDKHKQTQ